LEKRDEFAMKKICTLLLLNVYLVSCSSHAETVRQTHNKYDSFKPGEIRRDAEGNRIEAHGRGMFYERKKGWQAASKCVRIKFARCYARPMIESMRSGYGGC
jgi:hypothetical protein